jgi:hypothetical protein
LFSIAVFQRQTDDESLTSAALGFAAVFFAVQLAFFPRLYYPDAQRPYLWLGLCVAAAALIMPAYFGLKKRQNKLIAFCSVIIFLEAARVLTLYASPNPYIDVFIFLRDGCLFMARGINPYTQSYPDIYMQNEGFTLYPPALNYPPGVMYWLLPFQVATGDFRVGYIIADLVAGLMLFLVARKLGRSEEFSRRLALVWFAFPTCLFTLEQSWIDAFLIMTIGLLFYCLLSERWILAGLSLALVLAAKQYSVFIAFFAILWLLMNKGFQWRILMRIGVPALTLSLALYLPFFLADPKTLYYDLVTSLLEQPRRLDAFTWIALLENEFDIIPPNSAIIQIYVVSFSLILVLIWFQRSLDLRLCLAYSVILYAIVFLFGKQAFCNYYQLLSYMLCLYIASAMKSLTVASKSQEA